MTETADVSSRGSTAVPRKKFAVPPVKIACLACRASRTRCNGQRPCTSCVTKDRECVYKPSRRGGPRIRKKSRPLSDYHEPGNPLTPKAEEMPQNELLIEEYIGPGAGLKPLVDVFSDSDAIYDQLFQSSFDVSPYNIHVPVARTYGSDDNAILNAYYIWIHPYFPILPPPEQAPAPDQPSAIAEIQSADFDEPTSAISLAISAILALIPCSLDSDPSSEESIRWRRTFSQFLAKTALESIENENEKPESSVEPSKALDDSDSDVFREKFHPGVPLELESIIALDLLSVYEYAQRGNLKKMRARAGAALVAAMSLTLHQKNDTEDEYSEARRRTWWMTFICVCQGSIVSNTHPTFEIFSPSYTAKLPTIEADPQAWPDFLTAQRGILAATQFVIDFNKARNSGTNMFPSYNRMKDLEGRLEPLINRLESRPFNSSPTQSVDNSEAVVANALRCMARIKLNSARIKVHRYCAFFDVAVFTSKHCDLASLPGKATDGSEPQALQACCVAPLYSPPSTSGYSIDSLSPGTTDSPSPSANGQTQPSTFEFPFTSHVSTRICLNSALNIAAGFDAMPYPNPNGQFGESPVYPGSRSTSITPRTMPSFACCAMQCSYALLMVRDRIETLHPPSNSGINDLADDLRGRLQRGLFSMFATLENYATAFEALGGMRDQIRDKIGLQFDFNV